MVKDLTTNTLPWPFSNLFGSFPEDPGTNIHSLSSSQPKAGCCCCPYHHFSCTGKPTDGSRRGGKLTALMPQLLGWDVMITCTNRCQKYRSFLVTKYELEYKVLKRKCPKREFSCTIFRYILIYTPVLVYLECIVHVFILSDQVVSMLYNIICFFCCCCFSLFFMFMSLLWSVPSTSLYHLSPTLSHALRGHIE